MTNSWLSRVLYWNMNYHIEHHLYPTVPFHALPALNAAIRDQLPEPSASLLAAHVEILRTIAAQRRDPRAFAYHPLPAAPSASTPGSAA
jgi:fatty acid desaturase